MIIIEDLYEFDIIFFFSDQIFYLEEKIGLCEYN